MEPEYYLYLAQAVSAVAWTFIVRDFVFPRSGGSRVKLLQTLLLLHAFRFVGLGMFIPGVPMTISPEFIVPAAWGDFVAAVLCLVAYQWLAYDAKSGTLAAWIFSVWGLADLAVVFYQAFALQVANDMGVMFWIFSVYAPGLVVTHVAIVKVLLRTRVRSATGHS